MKMTGTHKIGASQKSPKQKYWADKIDKCVYCAVDSVPLFSGRYHTNTHSHI